ncbi:MAG: biotin--[acetyl-CoA-carboxylase] ligase [Rhodoferax sp.]
MTLRWPAEALWEAVVPTLAGFTVEIVPQIDSTNSELMRRARAGQTDPVLLVAERQTAGRGRLGRSWEGAAAPGPGASPGDLTFSLGLPLAPQNWSGLSLAVGLALVQSLHPALCLKWPNDVWWQQRKLAGILIETAGASAQRYVVIGVGINLAPRSADGLRAPPAALCELLPELDPPALLARLVAPLVDGVQRFAAEGFAPLQAAFAARDALAGCVVECSDGVVGQARGVDAQGALLVHTATGLKSVTSSEVSVRPRTGPAEHKP